MIRHVVAVVAPREGGERLDRYLAALFPLLPPKSLRHALQRRAVLLNGVPAAKGATVRSGDTVEVREMAEERDWLPVPGPVPGAGLLYEDRHLVVLDKPAGVHTDPHAPLEAGTLAGHLLHLFPQVEAIAARPGLTLATRLDYVTSGAVPAAISREGDRHIAHEREHGRIRKEYACVVEGILDGERVLRDRIDTEGGERVRVRRGVSDEDPSRWTRIRPVAAAGAGRTLVAAEIRKGRRHQIRAHLAAEGFPIVGDRSYGTVPREGPGAARLLLHARAVTFRRVEGDEVTVVSPLPREFREGGEEAT